MRLLTFGTAIGTTALHSLTTGTAIMNNRYSRP
jgi:hypothetical protein